MDTIKSLRAELETEKKLVEVLTAHKETLLAGTDRDTREILALRERIKELETEKAHWWAPKLTREFLDKRGCVNTDDPRPTEP